MLARHAKEREASASETMYVVLAPASEGERLLSHSEAAVHILSRIRGPLRAARVFGWLPHGLRDRMYALIARNRYRWFGKYQACPLPQPQWRERFLD